MDLRQSEKYGEYLGLLGWIIKEIPGDSPLKIFLRRLPVFGLSVGKIQRPEGKIDFPAVNKIAKENRALSIKLEPVKNPPSPESGFLPDRWPLLPTATIKINLSESFEEILARAGKDTRYCLRQAEKNNLTTKTISSPESADIEKFYRLWSINAKNRGFWIPFKKEIAALCRAFGKDAWIIFSQRGESLLAADLIVKADDTVYYLHAASTPEGR
ncbi:MAG: GNAT family N-acetyltransferase, partial [bacterium]|nr:GNAT family N-acetyltransferase [bacterium]